MHFGDGLDGIRKAQVFSFCLVSEAIFGTVRLHFCIFSTPVEVQERISSTLVFHSAIITVSICFSFQRHVSKLKAQKYFFNLGLHQ